MVAKKPKYDAPDPLGHFGTYGGRFVAETLFHALEELTEVYQDAMSDDSFWEEFQADLRDYVGRPSALYFASRLTQHAAGAQIYLKREDLNHTGAHKINNTVGQALLAARMGKQRIIAETGAGQHGVATATVAARLGVECTVYMGAEDIVRQAPNVFRMKMLGANVKEVTSGSQTLKDAMNEAMRDWVTNVDNTHYIIGSVAGPHPYPQMVRDFQAIIGRECKEQCTKRFGRLPDTLIACVGGGSNAMGLFYPFVDDESVELIGVEAAGHGLTSGEHAASLCLGKPGVLHGARTYLLADDDGLIQETTSISAGLDYPGVGPEHAFWKDIERASYVAITDTEAVEAFHLTNQLEGILPALESSHAIAYALKEASKRNAKENIVVNLSGRGDKDVATIAQLDGIEL